MNRVSTYDLFLQWYEKDFFLKEICHLDFISKCTKRTWFKDNKASTVAKSGLHLKKILLSIWWDWKDVIYEFFSQGETINSVKYCNQFDKLKNASKKTNQSANQRGHHDNAKSYVALIVREKLLVWLECSIASSVFFRSCFIQLLLVFVIKKFSPW